MANTSLKITLRTLHREKLYALINIAGLALAIAASLILALYLRSELTYDQHHVNHKKIYRLVNEFSSSNTTESFAVTSRVVGQMLTDDYPEVEDYVRFIPNQNDEVLLRYEDQVIAWDNMYFATENVFDVFTHEILYGDPETALSEPATAAISETAARRYFGDENPVGKALITANGNPNIIKLVFADLPDNTHLKYDVLFSDKIDFLRDPDNVTQRRQMLGNVGVFTYLVMPEDYNPEDFRRISNDFFDRHMSAMAQGIEMSWRSWVQPLADVHLYSDVSRDLPTGNRFYIYAFTAVAVFILVIACINYMNLSTARSAKRAREVGMRKILGVSRSSLVMQFLTESVIYSIIALVLGIVIVEVTLSQTSMNTLLGKPLTLSLLDEPDMLLWVTGASLVIGVLSGLYPAFYLSSWSPMAALAGGDNSGKANIRLRKLLVLVQFTISVGVIACTLLMGIQMRYIANKSLGFDKENRVLITLRGADLIEKIDVIKTELMKNSKILGITSSDQIMGKGLPINALRVETETGTTETTGVNRMQVADDFIAVMGMELVQGRDFTRRLLTDVGTSFVVNEALVNKMNWTNPVGKKIQDGRVIGVIKDFHFMDLHNTIDPIALHLVPPNLDDLQPIFRPFIQRLLIVSISGEDIYDTLSFLENKFADLDPTHPFDFEFLDDSLDQLYVSETRLMKLIAIFATICIFIACLGLFGLSAFTTEQRTREIGIRKVLGATASQIIMLLSSNILVLVMIGAVIASVMSYMTMEEWLASFAYRAETNYMVFLLSTAIALAVAYLTVASQSYKTAQANPVRALRYE